MGHSALEPPGYLRKPCSGVLDGFPDVQTSRKKAAQLIAFIRRPPFPAPPPFVLSCFSISYLHSDLFWSTFAKPPNPSQKSANIKGVAVIAQLWPIFLHYDKMCSIMECYVLC